MKITWLGQAGLLLEKGDYKIMIDPYFSDSVAKVNPKNYRRVPMREEFWEVKPNVLIFTHNHLDHYDPATAEKLLSGGNMLVLAPGSVWGEVRKLGGDHNYVLFNRHTSWTENGIQFAAVKAEHSDPTPIGVIIDDGEKTYYITGDTLYNEEIFGDVPEDIDVVFLPINGAGNNMNKEDAARFAKRIGAKKVVPIHFGMFDELTAEDFSCENKVIPEIYKEILL